jgi:hypothetical protein
VGTVITDYGGAYVASIIGRNETVYITIII